jgi:hypothetical protein
VISTPVFRIGSRLGVAVSIHRCCELDSFHRRNTWDVAVSIVQGDGFDGLDSERRPRVKPHFHCALIRAYTLREELNVYTYARSESRALVTLSQLSLGRRPAASLPPLTLRSNERHHPYMTSR